MACRCLHCVNGYTVPETGTVLALTFPVAVASATNEQRFCIKLCTEIPATYDAFTVTVPVGTAAVPLWNKYGNPLTVSQLKRGCVYKGYYGTGTTNHIILSEAPKVEYGCRCM